MKTEHFVRSFLSIFSVKRKQTSNNEETKLDKQNIQEIKEKLGDGTTNLYTSVNDIYKTNTFDKNELQENDDNNDNNVLQENDNNNDNNALQENDDNNELQEDDDNNDNNELQEDITMITMNYKKMMITIKYKKMMITMNYKKIEIKPTMNHLQGLK